MPQHSIEGLPTISWIGFYPSIETITAQIILIVLILFFVFKQRKRIIYNKKRLGHNQLSQPSLYWQ